MAKQHLIIGASSGIGAALLEELVGGGLRASTSRAPGARPDLPGARG
jgi:NAD(P)-dependent dehydrogenase (short-subunit alcohol dehydrogenase family)